MNNLFRFVFPVNQGLRHLFGTGHLLGIFIDEYPVAPHLQVRVAIDHPALHRFSCGEVKLSGAGFFGQFCDVVCIYATARHDVAKYNAGSDVTNSIISSGCIINSKVENSVLFKGVFVGNGCTIKNSIILNKAYIGDNVYVENCIVESNETLLSNTSYVGKDQIKIVSENNNRYGV